jgi:hypothetical protein
MIFCDWCLRKMPFYTSSEYLFYKDRIIDAIHCICFDCTPEMDDQTIFDEADDEYRPYEDENEDEHVDDDEDYEYEDYSSDWSENEIDDLLDDDMGWDDQEDEDDDDELL